MSSDQHNLEFRLHQGDHSLKQIKKVLLGFIVIIIASLCVTAGLAFMTQARTSTDLSVLNGKMIVYGFILWTIYLILTRKGTRRTLRPEPSGWYLTATDRGQTPQVTFIEKKDIHDIQIFWRIRNNMRGSYNRIIPLRSHVWHFYIIAFTIEGKKSEYILDKNAETQLYETLISQGYSLPPLKKDLLMKREETIHKKNIFYTLIAFTIIAVYIAFLAFQG